ncbi:3-dehydroquinate synthase [Legionella jamestowniensis]|uniref:3-dehydroquinate synthase n=1 Tax=Legionella jamestowniensis TaxID=455 RepID=A0A0W0UH51_9GAMM|nr:3-dehydroquinate synthase [Legionella jamestowniensis]KTD07146.1 3-dehydroquinate synthase [Legionella jamestowniensis]OCH98903.1 3-dehydroquinate synthase [Legionella jamestowniensis]SFL71580.1 3-dehydroquinate synthase [Legionella jamestowniensis DSM 19215]
MAKFDLYKEVVIHLPSQAYPILIGYNALNDKEILNRYLAGEQVLIVTNEKIASLYLSYLQIAFADKQCDVVVLQDGEEFKNQQSLFVIYDTLIAKRHHRDTTLIALGGGVIGDITGFAAATYQRGVRFLQIPTTLLAQVDASIGGKTAINHPFAKNMIGSFHQPAAVIIDLNTLNTLPDREFRAGFAEIIKYALLAGGEFLELVYNVLQDGMNSSPDLATVIGYCCRIKGDYVEQDEQEISGLRAFLNLGHTFAHALEAYTQYNRWLHGEAVAIGLYCAALLSEQCAQLDRRTVDLVDKMLLKAKLPRRIPKDIDLDRLRTAMAQDKKIKNKNLHFILMRAPGNCYIEDKVSEDLLRSILQAAVEGD